MITRSIRGLYLILALCIAGGSGLQAQIKTTTFNDQTIKENSIVVKYDNSMITAKGKAVSPKTLAADIRTQMNASIGRTIDSQDVEEWLISGNMEATLQQLNRIPGVKAFPNYVFYRDEMEVDPLDFTDQLTLAVNGENPFPQLETMYGDDLLNNGDFSTGDLTSWESFLNPGVVATVDASDSSVAVTDISGINGVDPWLIQINQILTDDQISSLMSGGLYELRFDARTDSANKEINVFFGHNGGGWENYGSPETLTNELSTYTQYMLIDQIWDNFDSGMKLGFELSLDDASFFLDNVTLRQVNTPASPAPIPALADSLVISIFSDEYDDVSVDTYQTVWSESNFAIDSLGNDKFIVYDSLNFVGIETVASQLDVTEMTNVHFNVWTPNADELRFKLVDFGPDGVYSPAFDGGDDTEYEVVFTNFPKSVWLTADIPLYVFEQQGMNLNNIAQIIFAAQPAGTATLAIDNLLFYDNGAITSDPLLSLQYGLNNDGSFNPGYSVEGADVDAFAAWEMTTGSDEVVVVVYDDGVDFGHPDLYPNRWVNPGEDLNGDGMITDDEWNGIDDDGNGYPDDFWGWSAVYDNNSYLNPGSFHGTHVAGILGAQGDNGYGISGVAQDVKIINVMIFNEFGGTDAISIIRGYEYITNLLHSGVDITAINQSWGGGAYLDLESDQQYMSVMTDNALNHADFAALWIVSAGNDASNRDALPFYSFPNNIQSPNIITVASTDDADNLSGFSDYGYFTVDVAAPGSSIISTLPPSTTGVEFGYLSGTSMASPHVSGILALAKAMYPDEDGFDLAARLFAGDEGFISSLANGEVGSGGRVNAAGTLDPVNVGGTDPIVTGAETQFHRTFVDGDAMETTGIVNNTDGDATVTSLAITGPNADNFYIMIDTESLPTLSAGEAFGIPVGFNNNGLVGDLTATLEVNTSAGNVLLELIGHEQGFGYVDVSPNYANFGSVQYGDELTTTFSVTNFGNSDMFYNVGQALFYYDLEYSGFINDKATFEPSGNAPTKSLQRSDTDFFDDLTAKVMLERGDRTLPVIEYVPGSHTQSELLGPEVVFSDDLNDPEIVAENWDLLSFGETEDYWHLENISDVEGDTNNVFLFGDFEFGYFDNAIPVAIPPAFDFSQLETGRSPAYLMFDVQAELEDGYDNFYINVISNGARLATIASTSNGSIINYGGYYTVYVDISQFAGLDNVEFWFIANSDFSYIGGFGALFDNVSVIVDDAAYFTSLTGGELAPGESEDVDVTIRTELLPPGDWILFTDVFANGFISYYGNGGDFANHVTEFSARNVALNINPMEQWLGEVPADEAIEFGFDAENVGTVDVDYYADVFITYNQPDFFDDNPFAAAAKSDALARFEESEKELGSGIDLVEHRNIIIDNASKRSDARAEVRASDAPRMNPSVQNSDIYFEDFESGEFAEGWDIFDNSFGLGNVFEVENFGTEESPFHMLDVGDVSENGWFVYNNTYTLAFSPTFSLADVPTSENTFMEFTYSFLLEPGWDFASVWLGVETEFGIQLIYGGSSEDLFFNDGGFYRSGFNISAFNGEENVFMAFLVETDQSVQSAWASFDDLDVFTSEKLTYIDPAMGTIDSAATQTFNVTVNTPWLAPGNYAAVSFIDYYNDELFVGRFAEQLTYFEIENQKPVAEDDFLAVITDEVVPLNAIINYMLSNDFDPEGSWLYLYDFEDPLFGDIKYTFDGPVYVAPEEGGKEDMFRYIITDGQKMDTATVYMSVGDDPHFPVGADQQFVFLEDESLSMSTIGMAAGVGFWENVMVWAAPHDDGVSIMNSEDPENPHSLTFSADENLFGQFSATLYVGTDDGSAWDSMNVSIVVTPVNDAPVADFATTIDGSTVEFADLSSDAIDMNAGGIVAWAWDFGDGNTSTEASPVYDYGTTGDFTVTLTVTDNGGLANTITGPVEIVSVSNEVLGGVPTEFAIQQNYPNPFNPSTNINYSLPEASSVTIVVYDLLGQRVAELVNTEKAAGYHTVAFDASALSSGVYIYQIKAGAFTQTKKMMLIK